VPAPDPVSVGVPGVDDPSGGGGGGGGGSVEAMAAWAMPPRPATAHKTYFKH